MIEKIKNFLANAKSNYSFCKEWLKTNGMIKIMGCASCIGLFTFSSWASLFLAMLVISTYKFAINKIPATYLNIVNIDFSKYVINAVIGLVIASVFLFII